MGAVLAGSREFIEEAWQWKQRIGGAMRQAGIIAAAGIHALRHHISRLAEDHENAGRLARHIAEIPGLDIDLEAVETNIVRFDASRLGISCPEFARRLEEEEGVRVSTPGPFLRAVTYIGISEADVDEAAAAMRRLARQNLHCRSMMRKRVGMWLFKQFGVGADPGKVDGATRPVCFVDAIDQKEVAADVAFPVVRP